jgi:hypothetical protein
VAASEGAGVQLHDLHSVAVKVASEGGLGEDGVHWTEDGARALGQVAPGGKVISTRLCLLYIENN